MKLISLSVALSVLLLTSCSITRPAGKTEAEVLFKEAKELIKDSRFLIATEKLNTLRSQYPYSYYATQSELLMADILFMQENYVEAASAYILFKDFHPKYKNIDYVVWRIAESFYKQRPDTFDRDLTPAKEAIRYYQDLNKYHNKSKYNTDASKKIQICRKMLEDRQMYIADFYYKVKDYAAARFRYLNIINDYPKIQKMVDHSAVRTILASAKLQSVDQNNECLSNYNSLKNLVSNKSMKAFEKAFKSCK